MTIDLTPAVCKEALEKEVGLVLAYHPPIFSGLKYTFFFYVFNKGTERLNIVPISFRSLTLSNPLQASLLTLAASGISVFSAHTTLDAIPGGTNDFLVSPFQFKSIRPCSKAVNPPVGFEGAGDGRVIELEEGLELDEIVKRVKSLLGLEFRQSIPPLFVKVEGVFFSFRVERAEC